MVMIMMEVIMEMMMIEVIMEMMMMEVIMVMKMMEVIMVMKMMEVLMEMMMMGINGKAVPASHSSTKRSFSGKKLITNHFVVITITRLHQRKVFDLIAMIDIENEAATILSYFDVSASTLLFWPPPLLSL